MESILLPSGLVSPGLWRSSPQGSFPSLCLGELQNFSLGLSSPDSGDFPGVGVRAEGLGRGGGSASFQVEREKEKEKLE